MRRFDIPPINPSQDQLEIIASELLSWYRLNRRDLPWRRESDPYRIWVSEIMLQQTQVATAIPYYQRFIDRFPTLGDLAEASTDEVLQVWAGLGYYSRARHFHTAVREVKVKYDGQVPSEVEQLRSLKGVGEYTAGAIASIAYNRSEPAVDGNVLRVITRLFAIVDDIGLPATRRRIASIVRKMIPDGEASDFTQALMELGALICSPHGGQCSSCPIHTHCQAVHLCMVGSLPINQKRTKVSNHSMLVVIWKHGDCYAVQKRPDRGLLAGQWQFPMVELPSGKSAIERWQEFIGDSSMAGGREYRFLGEYSYQFTHRRWDQSVYWLQATPIDDGVYAWVTRVELEQLHLITAHKRLLKHV